MRKLMMMMALAFCVNGYAVELNDSVPSIPQDDDVAVSKGNENLLSYGKEDADGWKTHSFSMHLAAGFTSPTNVPSGMSFAPFRSWEFQWTVFQYDLRPKNSWQTYSVGVGLNWRNYVLSTDKMFAKVADEVVLTDWDPKWSSKRSNIHVLSISVPFLFNQKFDRKGHFRFSLGPVVNFNVSANLNNSWEEGDNEMEVQTKHIGQRPVTVDFMGIFHVYGVGLYFKYSPNNVLRSGRGPQFRSLSFGLYL